MTKAQPGPDRTREFERVRAVVAASMPDGYEAVTTGTNPSRNYDVTPDGERFVMVQTPGGGAPPSITVVFNWFEELKAKTTAGNSR